MALRRLIGPLSLMNILTHLDVYTPALWSLSIENSRVRANCTCTLCSSCTFCSRLPFSRFDTKESIAFAVPIRKLLRRRRRIRFRGSASTHVGEQQETIAGTIVGGTSRPIDRCCLREIEQPVSPLCLPCQRLLSAQLQTGHLE